jgi:hypothetical protein
MYYYIDISVAHKHEKAFADDQRYCRTSRTGDGSTVECWLGRMKIYQCQYSILIQVHH